MIRILHSVSNMDRAGIETMLMNYYRYMDKSKVQFDFLCNKKKPGAYDDEIKSMGGRIYHTPGLNPAKYPVYLKYMRELFQEHPEYKIVEAHNGALGVYALHAAKVSKIPVRIFHAHGASITKDWKLPIKLVCKACLPTNMTHHFSCGVEAAKCYFGQKVVDENDYVLIPNAIDVARFIYNPKIRNKIHYAGQYLSTKEVQQQFTKAIFKKKFRAEHSKELDAYAESVKYFREENDGKLPSLKSLKKRKEKLTKEIAERKKAYAPLREESKRLEIASDNVYSIFRKTNEMKSDLAWKREWEAKVREKARQEQARQEQCERQPKRKKRSYDMSL